LRDLVDELLQAQVRTKLFGGTHPVMLGRWELRERLGAGAMGTVFRAYDPTLEREVAIKVLEHGDPRVLGEARALAKLAHPNVVTVYDAGELDGVVYIVMELVAGARLRTWAREPGRGWREIMHAARDAAQGLSAAHDAGLVHRDIKPDNIVVGRDRARVLDFGLAAATGDTARAGTPGYMAPEVVAGDAATALSDQYSFGVTLFEALYGTLPTASAKQPPGSGVPTWVHHVAVRALAPAPGDRFPSMREVVRALKRDHRRVRFGAILACTAVVGASLGAWTMHRGGGGDACGDAAVHRGLVWNESVRSGVKAGLGSAPWSARTIAAFDEASRAWETSYRNVCEATRVHGGQSDALLQLRMRCLDRSLDRLGALATALAGPKDAHGVPDAPTGDAGSTLDAAARVAAPTAVAALPQPTECETLTDAAALALPADPAQRDRARSTERDLDRGWAAFALGRYREAQDIATRAQTALAGLEAPAIRAGALVLDAATTARIGTPADAHARLQAALDAAAAAHSGMLELDIWARMLRTELFSGDPAHVLEWAPFARAAASRAGRQGAELDGIIAEADRDAGKLKAAKDLLDHALASSDPLRPDQRALLELNLGSVELALGDSTAALTTLTRARDRVITALGDRHPELALYDDKLAAANRARGKLRIALALHDQSLALRTSAFGADDRSVATSLYHRAQTELEAGELQKAEHSLHDALAIRTRVFGTTSARLGELYAALGACDLARDDHDGARDHFAQALRLDPRLAPALLGPRSDADDKLDDSIPPLAAEEPLSIDRAAALVALQHRSTDAASIAKSLHDRWRPDLDAELTVLVGRAMFAAGDRSTLLANLFDGAIAHSGNEPSRTSLAAAVYLAQCDDPRAGQAARTAISLFQAMPQLGRAEMPLMQERSKLP
jgi:eukaryotic-like serine/threonine-protein kinase